MFANNIPEDALEKPRFLAYARVAGSRAGQGLAARPEEEMLMLLLVVGLSIFFLGHLVPTQPEVRNGLIRRFGERAYQGLFALVALIGLALIVAGYVKLQGLAGKNPQVWVPPAWTRHAAFVLMIPAMVLLAAAYVPSRIRTALQHPMLAAVKIWAFAHLIANGDLASLLLFGSFLAYAVYDRISVKKRAALGPLGVRKGSGLGDAMAVAAGLALYAFILFWGHGWLIGVPLVHL